MQTYYVVQAFYGFAREAVRIAFTLFYLRIFTSPGARRVIYFTLAVNVSLAIAFIFVLLFSCTPVSYYWTKWDGFHVSSFASCLSQRSFTRVLVLLINFFELPNSKAWGGACLHIAQTRSRYYSCTTHGVRHPFPMNRWFSTDHC